MFTVIIKHPCGAIQPIKVSANSTQSARAKAVRRYPHCSVKVTRGAV